MQSHYSHNRLILPILTALLLTLTVMSTLQAQESTPESIPFSERTYELFVPESYSDDLPMPLVIVLHGASGWGARTRDWLGFDTIAEEMGFIVVYPDGIANNWDFGGGVLTDAGVTRIDDVGFMLWLIDNLAESYSIDMDSVFVVGISNGALMAYRLACEAADRFTGVAGVAAPVYVIAVQNCDSAPIPLLFMHGTMDPILPWARTVYRNGALASLSAPESMTFWAQRNRCNTSRDAVQVEEIPDIVTDDESTVQHIYITDCADNTEVHFYGIVGGGHTWPGHPFDVDIELGAVNMDIDATVVIMNWFQSLIVIQEQNIE